MSARTPIVFEWITPPECGGQIVEVSYGLGRSGERVYRWHYDASDMTSSFSSADADCGCECECDCWDPANREPRGFVWEPLDASEVRS